MGAGAIGLQPFGAFAGPFTRKDFERLVPADKKLHPDWLRSLTSRGERTVYRGTDLDKIGMPIGGICSGQLYLGGDGKLWHWDIFNQHIGTGSEHYAKPVSPSSPLDQGFAIRVRAEGQTSERSLDRGSWRDITFSGEYPIGYVGYQDPDFPVRVDLEAFSPFIPLNTEDSSLPVTVMEFTVHNQSQSTVVAELGGWLENAVCLKSGQAHERIRRNRLVRRSNALMLECSAEAPRARPSSNRPDITFDDFERATYGDWAATCTAFGSGPVEKSKVPDYQGDLGGHGARVVNSHASAPGATVEARDSATGTLTSHPFQIERDYINFLIGGGAHPGKTCVNLIVEGTHVLSATGRDENRMHPISWDVRRWADKTGRIEV
ncbi:MAG: GH116 family glycosyl-hydrolase, partial [Limisphaerales bacterium]